MAKYISNRQQNLKIGINSYTENKTVLEVTGKVGIGTTTATSKLYVVGDGYFTGVVTATTFYGDGSQLTGISASGGIAISTNTTNANQYIPYATSFGSTTGLGATTLLVFNPSSGNLGIGTTNPTSTLQIEGTVSVSSTTTSAEFVGGGSDLRNLSGTHLVSYASASDISNSALSIAGINTYTQVGILTGSLANNASDLFGYSVATSADGNTIIVGTTADELSGSGNYGLAYVFDRVGNSFNQVGILTGTYSVNPSDVFGNSVATSADGKTIVVGARADEIGAATFTGVVYVFDRVGNSFNQVGILTGTYAGDTPDTFGHSVAISADGKTIVVGAERDEIPPEFETGLVYVFDRVGNSFNQVGILTASLPAVSGNDSFGCSVATSADGKTIVVGSSQDNASNTDTGLVYVFDRVGNSFNQVGILTGSLSNPDDIFGYSVETSADGKTIIVGAISDELSGVTDTGLVYVFDRVGNSFNQVGILTGSLAADSLDNFGVSLATSADGKTIVVGAQTDEIGATSSTGVVYIFNRQGNSFNQVGILTGSFASQTSDIFGNAVSVSADGKTIVVGARNDEIGATTSTGIVYVFDQIRETYVYSGPTGNIGIGTTIPTSKLYVVGDTYVTGVVTASSFSGNASSASYATSSGIATSVLINPGVGISTAGGTVGTGATILDFRGSGISTVTVSAGIATINIIGTSGGGTIAITDDIATNATYYVGIANTTTGNLSTLNVSSSKLTFNPSTGNLVAGGTVTANSDEKLKTNIKTIDNALEKVLSLRGVEYDRIDTQEHQIGVIAQEVEKIIPEVVYPKQPAPDYETKSVAYANLVGLLIEAIKEQNQRIVELERRLEGT